MKLLLSYKTHFLLGTLILAISCKKSVVETSKIDNLTLHYNSPAKVWEATLPLGNGRLGMMPNGGIEEEKIVLNDITMWSGSREDAIDKNAIDYLPQIRSLLLQGKNIEAQNLMYKHFKCKGKGSAFGRGKDAPYGCFQMLGKMMLKYNYPNNNPASNYKRGLNLKNATAFTQFTKGDVQFIREYFVSHSNDVMVIRLHASQLKSISFKLSLFRPENATITTANNHLIMEGQLNNGKNGEGVQYKLKVHIRHKGGSLSAKDKSLSLQNADEAVVIISSSTNFFDKNYQQTTTQLLNKSLTFNYKKLKENHRKEYQKKFNRVTLHLGEGNVQVPTNVRLQKFQTENDPSFAALYFQYGRYLMISGTRKNSLPLNLQGLWANTVQTPWNGDYHLNINVQMNYWATEIVNLSELHQPLIEFTKSLVPSGKKTAKGFYNANGWVAHVISNPWAFTAPGEHASWGATNTGGAWLCQHLWEHYTFTQDKKYLQSVYPVLSGAAQFFLSSMIKEPQNGWWVTAPSSSPENGFYLPNKKTPVYVCMGPTMDVQIITELFTNVLKAAEMLKIEDGMIQKIKTVLLKLPPMQISKKGYLQEWLEDYKEVDVHHRHVSHLYGLYPSNQITPYRTPKLAEAAKKTLNRRGDEGTGWSRAWKINFWARLHNGNRAYKLLKSLLKPVFDSEQSIQKGKGGTYPNLFCAHPPFQIDGNFGGMAGIAEMLLQSHDGFIEFLPALPTEWKTGYFKGLKVRGGAEVDVKWEENQLQEVILKSANNHIFRVKIPDYISLVIANNKEIKIEQGFVQLPLKEGEKVILNLK